MKLRWNTTNQSWSLNCSMTSFKVPVPAGRKKKSILHFLHHQFCFFAKWKCLYSFSCSLHHRRCYFSPPYLIHPVVTVELTQRVLCRTELCVRLLCRWRVDSLLTPNSSQGPQCKSQCNALCQTVVPGLVEGNVIRVAGLSWTHSWALVTKVAKRPHYKMFSLVQLQN